MVMIDCLIEVAVFTVVALGGMGCERPWHAYSCIHFKDFFRTATNLNSSLTCLHTSSKQKERLNVSSAEELCTWLCRPWQNWKDLLDIYRQHSFSLSCETAPNTVLQDTWTNNNGKQVNNLVTFERNKKLLGLWYTYVTACKQCFNN